MKNMRSRYIYIYIYDISRLRVKYISLFSQSLKSGPTHEEQTYKEVYCDHDF